MGGGFQRSFVAVGVFSFKGMGCCIVRWAENEEEVSLSQVVGTTGPGERQRLLDQDWARQLAERAETGRFYEELHQARLLEARQRREARRRRIRCLGLQTHGG